ncbi:divalent-cation tolerance protein CutA [Xanthobacter sp. V3C-3]|uniref:divalent-cation tolerance protein CutA n=1 Tax=Xanthobacter lutulentifluminis TaxID=3119935 RepID=UPI0037298399
MDARLIYTTFPSLDAASDAATSLVEAGLVACANILPGMVSIYRWEGRTERADEVVMLLKTTIGRTDAVLEALGATHPHDLPAALVLKVEDGLPAFLSWIAAEVAPRQD